MSSTNSNRTNEIFLICCLEGDADVITRIFKRTRKSWILGNHTNFDINCRDSSCRTGLILAVLSKSQEIVDLLLSRPDLDVNCSDRYGCNALMYATKDSESIEIVRLLFERKDLDLDEKDIDGKTAEDFATEMNNIRAVKMIREERLRRMGKVWTKEDSGEEDDESELEERTSTPESEEVEETKPGIQGCGEKVGFNIEERQNEVLKCQLTANLMERLEKEKFLLQNHEHMHEINLGKLLSEKQKEEDILKQNLRDVEEKYTSSKNKLEAEFLSAQSASQSLIAKLEGLIANMNLDRLLSLTTEPRPSSELECPVCLEEMRPPMRIWQCGSGHPVCDICVRNPRVKECPTCRQKITGRNMLAEKLAMSLYGN